MFGKYSLWSFGVFCPLWYVWTNKNLATLGPMIIKIFSPENLVKILAFLTQNKANFLMIITLVFEKSANFFVENRRKLWS
jgi:hypothetical protein